MKFDYPLWFFLTSGAVMPEYVDAFLRPLGWLFAIAGSVLLVIGFAQIVHSIISKTGLVKTGLYSLVRHPQHLGIATLTLGIVLGWNRYGIRPGDIIGWIILNSLYIMLALREEESLNRKFGAEFVEYTSKVPFVIPFVPPSLSSSITSAIPSGRKGFIVIAAIVFILILFVGFVFSLFPLTHPR